MVNSYRWLANDLNTCPQPVPIEQSSVTKLRALANIDKLRHDKPAAARGTRGNGKFQVGRRGHPRGRGGSMRA